MVRRITQTPHYALCNDRQREYIREQMIALNITELEDSWTLSEKVKTISQRSIRNAVRIGKLKARTSCAPYSFSFDDIHEYLCQYPQYITGNKNRPIINQNGDEMNIIINTSLNADEITKLIRNISSGGHAGISVMAKEEPKEEPEKWHPYPAIPVRVTNEATGETHDMPSISAAFKFIGRTRASIPLENVFSTWSGWKFTRIADIIPVSPKIELENKTVATVPADALKNAEPKCKKRFIKFQIFGQVVSSSIAAILVKKYITQNKLNPLDMKLSCPSYAMLASVCDRYKIPYELVEV